MEASLAAFQNLCVLAGADGRVGQLERRVLQRYRRALHIRASAMRWVVEKDLVTHDSISDSPEECAHILKMMVRVAYADGDLREEEKELLTQLAKTLGIGTLQLADILVSAE